MSTTANRRKGTMKMNRIAFMSTIILAIFMVLPSHFIWSIAKAGESLTVADGIYQVELSFLSLEAVEHEELFSETATLTVEKGRYILSVPIKHKKILTAVTVRQQDGSKPLRIDRAENLVQFDVKNLQQMIAIDGVIEKPAEETSISFSEQITIHTNGLPPIEVSPAPPSIVEPDDREESLPPIVVEGLKESFINYLLLADGTNEPSVMNTYVDPLIKIIKIENKYYAQMKILKSSWLTGLKVEQQGEMIEPKTISLVDNTRLIQFEVENLEGKVRLWVQVDIPEIAYHHQYYVQLHLNKAQLAKFSGETLKPANTEPKPNKTPDKKISNPIQKPVQKSIQESIQEPIQEPVQKPIQQAMIPKPEKYYSGLISRPTSQSLEEVLAFDRTLDEAIEKEEIVAEEEKNEIVEAKQDADNGASQLAPLDKIKIGLLVIVCILSGILLVRRIKKAKKAGVDE